MSQNWKNNKMERLCSYILLIIITTFIFLGQSFFIQDSISAKIVEIEPGLEQSSTTNKQYTNDFEEKREVTNGDYSGIEQLVDVEKDTELKTNTFNVSKTFNETDSNTITNFYDADGNYKGVEYSAGTDNIGNTYEINEDGYSGSIPRVDTTCTDPRTVTSSDGSYKVIKTCTAHYSGLLTKTVTESELIDYYFGKYEGLIFHINTKEQNLGTPVNSEGVNEPVNIVTGNYYASASDLTIPDLGLALEVNRFYNSLDQESGLIGKSWKFSYESFLEVDSIDNVTITYPDGRKGYFMLDEETGLYIAPQTIFDTLIKKTDTYELTWQSNKATYIYDMDGKLIAIRDRNDNTVTLEYDESNQLSKVIGASGNHLSINIVNGRIHAVTDAIGRTIEYTYVNDELRQVKGIGGGTTTYTYNSHGLTSITDENGNTFINNEYDPFGRVIRQLDADQNVITYDYDDVNYINTYTVQATGRSVSYEYNERLYITKKSFDDDTYEQYGYDEWGNRISVRDRNGNITQYEYDERGNLLLSTSPSPFSYQNIYEYDAFNNLVSVTRPNGQQTTFGYDNNHNLIKTTKQIDDNNQAITSYTYDLSGRLETITDAEGNVQTYTYGTSNQPIEAIDREQNMVSYVYDEVGRIQTSTNVDGTISFEYNDNNKIEKITDAEGHITRMKYDVRGNLIKTIFPEQYDENTDDGIGTSYVYDALDNPIQVIDPLDNVIAMKYDVDGNKIKDINPNQYNAATDDGTGISYKYNDKKQITHVTYPSGQQSSIVYDGVGNIIKTIDANHYDEQSDDGKGMQYFYDEMNRLIEERDPEGNVIKRYVYDENNFVTKIIDVKGYLSGNDDSFRYGTLYTYNLTGWLLEQRVPLKQDGDTVLYRIATYEYDKLGRIEKEKKSTEYVTEDSEPTSWHEIQYTYDGNGKVTSVVDSAGAHMEYVYDAFGRTILEKVKMDDQQWGIKGYEYNAAGRLIHTWNEIDAEDVIHGGTESIKSQTTRDYDGNGNLIKVTSPEGYVTEFIYNEANRLIEQRQEVQEDQIDVLSTKAIIDGRKIVYPEQTYEYKLKLQPDGEISSYSIDVEYDTRILELVEIGSIEENTSVNSDTLGKIHFQAENANYTEENILGSMVFRVKENTLGTGYVTISPTSTYVDGEGTSYQFTEVIGQAAEARIPDMNDNSLVETNDFTFTALLDQVQINQPEYEEKYDINGNRLIDVPDLDYIKDWLFADKTNVMQDLSRTYFAEKQTSSVYKVDTATVTRTIQYEYDKAGNLIKEIDPNGHVTTYIYDAYNRLIEVIDRENGRTKLEYDEVGNVTKEVLPEQYDENLGVTYSYDSLNRLEMTTNVLGNVIQKNIYDVNGNLIKVIDANGYDSSDSDDLRYGLEYTYDIGNRLLTLTTPETKNEGITNSHYTYNALNHVLTYSDGLNNTTTYVRDIWGNPLTVTNAEGYTSEFKYDLAGNLLSSTDGNGNTMNYEYNQFHLLKSITDPLGQTVSYVYDLEGRLRTEVDRNNQTIAYVYNRDHQLVTRSIEGDENREKFLYNKDGSILAAINDNGVNEYRYTANGYLASEWRNGQQILTYEYDQNGNIVGFVEPSGDWTRYSYDDHNRIQKVFDGEELLATYNYNKDSTIANTQYSTGIQSDYTYDKDLNILGLTHKNTQNEIISQYVYTYDVNGNLLSEIENGELTEYTYDKLNQLHTVFRNNELETYTYDAIGNRIEKIKGTDTTTYRYDPNNRLLEQILNGTQTTFTYDPNGNLLKEITGEQEKTYTYDGYNRLIQTFMPDGTWMDYDYNAQGWRHAISENGIRSEFTEHFGQVILEQNNVGEVVNRTLRGYSILAQQDHKDNSGYYLQNGHGDVVSIVDGTGKILNAYEYDAFGNTTNAIEQVANRFLYAGEQFDAITDQYYLRARYYNPQIGRFTQEDTFRGDGLNLYVYVSNNPLRYIDPSGYWKDDITSYLVTSMDFSSNFIPFANSIPDTYFEGAANSVYDSGEGIVYMFIHPKQTLDGAVYAITNPDVIIIEAYEGSIETISDLPNKSKEEIEELIGYSLADLISPAKKVDAVGDVASIGKKINDNDSGSNNDTDSNIDIDCIMNCFTAGTKVLTEDGEKPIEEIQVGDKVLAKDDVTGEMGYKEVVGLFQREANEIYSLYIEDEIIEVTAEHPFWLDGEGWTLVKDLQVGDYLVSTDGSIKVIDKIEIEQRNATVYNFEVEDYHSYFVSNLGIWVHNCSPTWNGSGPAPGVIGVNANSKSVEALKNYYPKNDGVEFVFDAKTNTFVVGSPKSGSFEGSPHQKLAQTIGADGGENTLGGTFSRGSNGEIITTENSGHYGTNWTSELRQQYQDVMKSYGIEVQHEKWVNP
ncbi:polymorphic toxin-type HINT domain-containing protein [Chengkuizengella sp. SCS-71B]|uniref:polymorphic toxin-type HINT domain-containing protein n=1 Tax=Chengkuizengella sp. SCS-71B TaxID=3115290 RepID=UPI0032C23B6A